MTLFTRKAEYEMPSALSSSFEPEAAILGASMRIESLVKVDELKNMNDVSGESVEYFDIAF